MESKKQGRISIIMPVYNGVSWIGECIESIRQQTDTNWELLVLDDHSTDGTTELVFKLAEEDSRILLQQLPYRADVVFVPVRDENSFHAPRPDIFQPWNNLVLSGLFLRRTSGIHQIYMMLPGFDSNALSLPDVQHRDVQFARQADQKNPHQTHSCCKPEVRTEFFA